MLSDVFYIVNFSFGVLVSLIGIVAGFAMIIIIVSHRRCHTILNLLKSNTVVAMIIYSATVLISSVLGMKASWSRSEPACAIRAYIFNTICAIICYSYAIQAISRLFYTVLFRFKFLITWKAHWCLIIFSWLINMVIQGIMFIFNRELFNFEEESRWCLGSTQTPVSSLCSVIVALFVPVSIMLIAYIIIFSHIRQSTRRVQAFTIPNTLHTTMKTTPPLNAKREIKVMKNMMLIIFLMFCSGSLYLLLLIWNLAGWPSPPASLYLINLDLMAVGVTMLTVLNVWMNKEVKTVMMHHIRNWRTQHLIGRK